MFLHFMVITDCLNYGRNVSIFCGCFDICVCNIFIIYVVDLYICGLYRDNHVRGSLHALRDTQVLAF